MRLYESSLFILCLFLCPRSKFRVTWTRGEDVVGPVAVTSTAVMAQVNLRSRKYCVQCPVTVVREPVFNRKILFLQILRWLYLHLKGNSRRLPLERV